MCFAFPREISNGTKCFSGISLGSQNVILYVESCCLIFKQGAKLGRKERKNTLAFGIRGSEEKLFVGEKKPQCYLFILFSFQYLPCSFLINANILHNLFKKPQIHHSEEYLRNHQEGKNSLV